MISRTKTWKRPAINSRLPSAFTLLELVAVLAIMGMLVGVAVVSLKDVCRAARLQYAVEQLHAFDRQVRDHANLHGRPACVIIDLDKNALIAKAPGRKEKFLFKTLGPGAAGRIDRIYLGQRTIDYGRVTMAVSDRGTTPTYAMRLRGGNGEARCFLFAGFSGQVTEFKDDSELKRFMEELASARFNAH